MERQPRTNTKNGPGSYADEMNRIGLTDDRVNRDRLEDTPPGGGRWKSPQRNYGLIPEKRAVPADESGNGASLAIDYRRATASGGGAGAALDWTTDDDYLMMVDDQGDEHHRNWQCKCPTGYIGPTCEISVCDNNPCQYGGTCIPYPGSGYLCLCPFGKHGHYCEHSEYQPGDGWGNGEGGWK